MKKKLLFLMMLLPMMASAYEGEATINGLTYWVNTNNGTASVVNSSKCSGDIVIPSSVVYSGVTCCVNHIGKEAFSYSSGLTSVTIPNSVIGIARMAFAHCKALKSVTIPNSVTTIGKMLSQAVFL